MKRNNNNQVSNNSKRLKWWSRLCIGSNGEHTNVNKSTQNVIVRMNRFRNIRGRKFPHAYTFLNLNVNDTCFRQVMKA